MLTVREAFELHIVPDATSASNSLATYRFHIGRWERLTSNPDCAAVTSDTIRDFRRASLRIGARNDTTEGSIATVLLVLRRLAMVGIIPMVPWKGVALRCRCTPKWVPTPSDLGVAYLQADSTLWPCHTPPGDWWRAFLCLAYFTGLRLRDLLQGLQWDGVTDSEITVVAHKTGKVHVFPAHPVVARHLAMLPRAGPCVLQVGCCHKQLRRELHRMSAGAGLAQHITAQPIRRLSATQWQAAKWGAGEVIQGSAIRGSARLYIVPQILQDAVDFLCWPEQMLTPQERDRERAETVRMLRVWKRLNAAGRQAVSALAERLA